MAKRHKALVKDGPRFKATYSKALAATAGCSTRTGRRASHGGRFIVLEHGEAAPSASVGPAPLQGRALEGACDDDDLVFHKDGKTRTSQWAFSSFCVFPSRPLQLYACFLLFFLCVFLLASRAAQKKVRKGGCAQNQQPRAETTAAVAAAVAVRLLGLNQPLRKPHPQRHRFL